MASAAAVADYLEEPHRVLGTQVAGGHVWHCSLSLAASEGQLSNEKWRQIAEDFTAAMGFDDHDGTKAPVRWVAVRHGLSKNGNDHVHLAVNLVREDGTKASTHNDYVRAQHVAAELEVKHGLVITEGRAQGRGSRGYHQAEVEAQARSRAKAKHQREHGGSARAPRWEHLDAADRARLVQAQKPVEQPRLTLARTVRECAVASRDEAEFVRRLRRANLIVKGRLAEGRADVVTGYIVAQRPVHGERPIWYAGGSLGRDLTLPRLRQEWPDTPQNANAAVAEWTAGRRGRRPVAPGREAREGDPKVWRQHAEQLAALNERLRAVPLEDTDTWARVARQTSGAFAAWSRRLERTPGPLAEASRALSLSAQTRQGERPGSHLDLAPLGENAMILLAVTRSGGKAAQVAMFKQLANLTKSVHSAAEASGQAQQAARLASLYRTQLTGVHERLVAEYRGSRPAPSNAPEAAPAPVLAPELAAIVARADAAQPRGPQVPRSPLPVPIEPRRVQPTTPAREGPER
ncbi:relaxase/mobilization nuclease domain-containing protein [Cellulomonas marina]|nr:relaxase/mobilization nuclease domain-containing protein [Cellulomonas marina]